MLPNDKRLKNLVAKGRGRPKGSKNKSKLLAEVIRTKSEEQILKHLPKILEATIEQAQKGNMQAVKLLLDRVLPAKRSVEVGTKDEGGLKVNIVVDNLVTHEIKKEIENQEEEIEEAEFEELKNDQEGRK